MTSGADDGERYRVELSRDAFNSYLSIESDREAQEVEDHLELLGAFPHIGLRYDPLYEAARPAFELRVLFVGRFGIYYDVDEQHKQVNVDFIEDQRGDPTRRFDFR